MIRFDVLAWLGLCVAVRLKIIRTYRIPNSATVSLVKWGLCPNNANAKKIREFPAQGCPRS